MDSDLTCGRELFQCTQCGECCKGFGGTYVGEADIAAIAAYLGISVETCKQVHCVSSGRRTVLAQREDGYCIFWERNCMIHPVKPAMCRNWPFIGSLLKDMANWHIMAAVCPGMRRDVHGENLARQVRAAVQARCVRPR